MVYIPQTSAVGRGPGSGRGCWRRGGAWGSPWHRSHRRRSLPLLLSRPLTGRRSERSRRTAATDGQGQEGRLYTSTSSSFLSRSTDLIFLSRNTLYCSEGAVEIFLVPNYYSLASAHSQPRFCPCPMLKFKFKLIVITVVSDLRLAPCSDD